MQYLYMALASQGNNNNQLFFKINVSVSYCEIVMPLIMSLKEMECILLLRKFLPTDLKFFWFKYQILKIKWKKRSHGQSLSKALMSR